MPIAGIGLQAPVAPHLAARGFRAHADRAKPDAPGRGFACLRLGQGGRAQSGDRRCDFNARSSALPVSKRDARQAGGQVRTRGPARMEGCKYV